MCARKKHLRNGGARRVDQPRKDKDKSDSDQVIDEDNDPVVEEMPMIEINDVEPQNYREKSGEERRGPGFFRPDANASPAMLGGVHHRLISA